MLLELDQDQIYFFCSSSISISKYKFSAYIFILATITIFFGYSYTSNYSCSNVNVILRYSIKNLRMCNVWRMIKLWFFWNYYNINVARTRSRSNLFFCSSSISISQYLIISIQIQSYANTNTIIYKYKYNTNINTITIHFSIRHTIRSFGTPYKHSAHCNCIFTFRLKSYSNNYSKRFLNIQKSIASTSAFTHVNVNHLNLYNSYSGNWLMWSQEWIIRISTSTSTSKLLYYLSPVGVPKYYIVFERVYVFVCVCLRL